MNKSIIKNGVVSFCCASNSMTSKKKNGKYGLSVIINDELTEVPTEITQFIKVDSENGNRYIHIGNSTKPFNFYDKHNKKVNIEEISMIPESTLIDIAVTIKHSDEFDCDYLVVDGVRINIERNEFNTLENNPFE